MSNYYVLAHDASRDDLEAVSSYELHTFDLTVFWSGRRFNGSVPKDVRVWVTEGDRPSDFLGNPLSWPIVSERFWRLVQPLAENTCQVIDPPLYYETSEEPVAGYRLLNVTRSVKASLSREVSIPTLQLEPKRVPRNVHLFRLAESRTVIIVSSALVELITQKGLEGVALIDCG